MTKIQDIQIILSDKVDVLKNEKLNYEELRIKLETELSNAENTKILLYDKVDVLQNEKNFSGR